MADLQQSMQQQQQQQQQQAPADANRPRRAKYIHVSDVTSAYNIDHARLEQELARVTKEQHSPSASGSVDSGSGGNIMSGKKTERLAGGVPAELDTSEKKRLQPPKGGSNMVVLVGRIRLVVDKNRVDGSRVRLAEVEVGDETGTVSLRARDNQIDVLQEVSSRSGAVVLRNCTLELFQGKHIRLAVTKWGKLSPYPDNIASTPAAPSKMNKERNFSLIDLSVVASETAEDPVHRAEPYEASQRSLSTAPQGSRGGYAGQQHRNRNQMHRTPMRPILGPPQAMHYVDNSLRMGQYGQDGGMSPYGAYAMQQPSQPYYTSPATDQELRAHQHQMMQHHHHHQLRMQSSLSYSPRQQQQRPDNQGPPTSPMLLPGTGFPPELQALHMPPPVSSPPGAYLLALQQHQHQQQQQRTPKQQDSRHRYQTSESGFMNPQAASFDPSSYPPSI